MRVMTVGAAAGLAVAALVACQPVREPEPSGRALYEQFCASCHGTAGRGDGAAGAGLAHRPADLTRIAARSGGTFPMVRVMSTIDGYTRRGDRATVMPEMGAILAEGPTAIYVAPDGTETPTPARLLALAEYLASIQR
jgi:mono/diheme cytochrome c family protein